MTTHRLFGKSSWDFAYGKQWADLLGALRNRGDLPELPDRAAQDLENAAAAIQEGISAVKSKLGHVVPSGDRLMALCPYHDDKSIGSFVLYPSTGWFRCYACGARGPLPRLMHTLGVPGQPVVEALKHIDLPTLFSSLGGRKTVPFQALPVLPEGLLDRYNYRPALLLERGHPARLLDHLQIGFDMQRHRIVYPVRKMTGELVALQTRAVDVLEAGDKHRRWLFYKREILEDLGPEAVEQLHLQDYQPPRDQLFFNEHNVFFQYGAGMLSQPLVLVEGPGHALRVMATGHPVVASFGLSLSTVQKERLRFLLLNAAQTRAAKPELIVAFDGEVNAWKAACAVAAFLTPEVNVRVARLPDGADPEDLSATSLQSCLFQATPYTTLLRQDSDMGELAREGRNRSAQAHLKKLRWERAQERQKQAEEGGHEPSATTLTALWGRR